MLLRQGQHALTSTERAHTWADVAVSVLFRLWEGVLTHYAGRSTTSQNLTPVTWLQKPRSDNYPISHAQRMTIQATSQAQRSESYSGKI